MGCKPSSHSPLHLQHSKSSRSRELNPLHSYILNPLIHSCLSPGWASARQSLVSYELTDSSCLDFRLRIPWRIRVQRQEDSAWEIESMSVMNSNECGWVSSWNGTIPQEAIISSPLRKPFLAHFLDCLDSFSIYRSRITSRWFYELERIGLVEWTASMGRCWRHLDHQLSLRLSNLSEKSSIWLEDVKIQAARSVGMDIIYLKYAFTSPTQSAGFAASSTLAHLV